MRPLIACLKLEVRLTEEHYGWSPKAAGAKCVQPVGKSDGVPGGHTCDPTDPSPMRRPDAHINFEPVGILFTRVLGAFVPRYRDGHLACSVEAYESHRDPLALLTLPLQQSRQLPNARR